MDVSLIDVKFSLRLASRHLLGRMSYLLPLRPKGSRSHRKAKLPLVYRSLIGGISGRDATGFTENILHSYAGNMTHIHLSFGFLRKETSGLSAEKGGMGARATEAGCSSSLSTSPESRLRAAKPMLTLAMIPAFMGQGDMSRTASAGRENKGSYAGDERTPALLPAQWLTKRPKEGRTEGRPVLPVTSAAQMLQKTEKSPGRLIGEAKPSAALRSVSRMLHRTEESPERHVSDIKPAAMRSAAQMFNRTKENPERTISDAKPAAALRSAARMLHRTKESPERLVGDAQPAVGLASFVQTQYRGLNGTPLVTRQSPKIDVGDPLAGADYPAMDFWTNQRTLGQSTMDAPNLSAPMVYAVPTSPPVERESKKEVIVKREEPKAPAINISALSDRIYSMIESRLKIDRERRGVCG